MFGFFKPSCPVNSREKAWIERRMRWLADQFGIQRLKQATLALPTSEFMLRDYRGSEADLKELLARLSRHMQVKPQDLRIEVTPDEEMPDEMTLHERADRHTLIRVAHSIVHNQFAVIAMLAHELAHIILLGEGRLGAEEQDQEWVADLLPTFLGLGLFTANATVSDSHYSNGHWFRFHIQRLGHLPSVMHGYALALFAFMRGEEKPAWVSHLRPDAASAVRDGLKYLRKTGDALFHPDTVQSPLQPRTVIQLLDLLQSGTASKRIDAIWELQRAPQSDGRIAAALAALLGDEDAYVSAYAAELLGSMGSAAAPFGKQLVGALSDSRETTRGPAAKALATLGIEKDAALPRITYFYFSDSDPLINAAAEAMITYNTAFPLAVDPLLNVIERRLVALDEAGAALLVQALRAIAPDAEFRLRQRFADEWELRGRAAAAFAAATHGGVLAGASDDEMDDADAGTDAGESDDATDVSHSG